MKSGRQLVITSRAQWRTWLSEHYKQAQGIWLVYYKKGHPHHVSPNDITEEALCFGWIDSLPRALDNDRSQLYLAPRKAKSAWSKLNKERAERMIKAKRMTAAGLQKIKQAKLDGSWDFLVDVQAGQLPDDLAAALRKNKKAQANFDAFPPSSKRIILEWIKNAKKAETRQKRIVETVTLAAQNIKANHYRQ